MTTNLVFPGPDDIDQYRKEIDASSLSTAMRYIALEMVRPNEPDGLWAHILLSRNTTIMCPYEIDFVALEMILDNPSNIFTEWDAYIESKDTSIGTELYLCIRTKQDVTPDAQTT